MSLKGSQYLIPDPVMSVDPTTLTLTGAAVPTSPMVMGTHVAPATGAFILKGTWTLAASTEVRFTVLHATASSSISTVIYSSGTTMMLDFVKQVTAGDTITISRQGTAANTIVQGHVCFYFVSEQ
jgi:predicted phage tail protein